MDIGGHHHFLVALLSGKDPGIHGTGRCVGSRACLDVLEKIIFCTCRDSNPGPTNPWLCRYTDHGTTARSLYM